MRRTDPIERKTLTELVDRPSQTCLSLFMPTEKPGMEAAVANRIRFKNLVREAAQRLENLEGGRPDIEAFLKPAYALLDDRHYWSLQEHGLAYFLSRDFERSYRVSRTLESMVAVDDRFRIAPLVAVMSEDRRFYILAVSLDGVRLYEATRTEDIREVKLEHTPRHAEDVIGAEVGERRLQWHTGTPGARGGRSAVFHGHGEGEDDETGEVRTYYAAVARALPSDLAEPGAPVVLVGLPHVVALYRDVDRSSNLCETSIRCNPDSLGADALHARAWSVVEPVFHAPRREAIESFRSQSETDRTSVDLEQIVPASWDGRVDTLLIASGEHRPGSFDPSSRRVRTSDESGPQDGDLIDLAAARTLAAGGRTLVVDADELPGSAVVAAVYRY